MGGGVTNPLFAAAAHEIGGDIADQDNDQNTGKLNGTHNNKEEITFTENAKFTTNQTLGDKTISIINNANKIGGDGGDKTLTITGEAKDRAKITIQNNSNTTEGWNSAITATGYKGELILNNGDESAAAKWTKAVTAGTTDETSKLTINNANAKSEWSGNIDAKGAADIINKGTMSGTITTAGKTSITNDGEISGAITANGATDITNNGTISAGVTLSGTTASKLANNGKIDAEVKLGGGTAATKPNFAHLQNAGGATIKKVNFTESYAQIDNYGTIGSETRTETAIESSVDNKVGQIINNHSTGKIISKITMSKASGDTNDKLNVLNNWGTISGDIEVGKDASTDMKGNSVNNYNIITGAVTLQGKNINLTNSGSITGEITLKGGTATANEHLTITNSGSIDKIKLDNANSVAHISNSGQIGSLNFAAAGTAVLGKNFAVTLEDKASYDTNGAIKIDGNTNATIKLEGVSNARAAGDKAFIVNIGQGFQVGEAYDLKNFIKANAIQNAQGTSIKDTLAQSLEGRIDTTQNIYDINFSGGAMTISVEANKSIGALGAIQSIANMNSQMTRAQSIIDGVFDAVATGEIGNLSYPREGTISTQYTGASKKSKLEELAEAVESEKDPKVKEEKLALLLAEKERANKSWIGFATPYFSTSSIAATGFAATNGSAMGFVGGAAKALDNGVLFGAHIGVESQNAGKVGAEMQSLGSSFMAGVHTKMPLGQVNKASLSLVPFVKLQANAMLAANSYRLTPLMDTTREATGLVSGFSASALFGLDMPTNFGYITPEIGLMQQAVIMPELAFNSFNTAANNQTIKGTTATPMYLLAQVRYTKAIKLEKMSLFPTIKAGIRYAMAGNSFVSSINVQNGLFYATNNIDSFVGVLEAGLGAKLGQNTAINLSYGGEFGAQVKTHNINVRVGWQF